MRLMSFALLTLLMGLTLRDSAHGADDKKADSKGARSDLQALNLQLNALKALSSLELDTDQQKALLKLAEGAADKNRERGPVKASDALKKAMTDLRLALAKGDDLAASELTAQMDKLVEDEEVEFDEDVDVSEEARKRVPDFLKLLKVRQVAAYLSDIDDDLNDPVEFLVEAVETGLDMTGDDWKQHKVVIGDEAARLVAGFDAAAAAKTSKAVAAFLEKTHSLKEDEFKKKKVQLTRDAREVVGDVPPLTVLKNMLDYKLALLLSNPEFAAALKGRLEYPGEKE